jgi:hypothetical protein
MLPLLQRLTWRGAEAEATMRYEGCRGSIFR